MLYYLVMDYAITTTSALIARFYSLAPALTFFNCVVGL